MPKSATAQWSKITSKEGAVTTLKIGSKALKAWHFSDSIIGKGLLTDALAKEITAATTGLAEVKEELAGAGETWEPVFSKAFDADTAANQRWDLAKPCKKIRLRMAVAGSVANSAAGDQTVYMNSYTSKCFCLTLSGTRRPRPRVHLLLQKLRSPKIWCGCWSTRVTYPAVLMQPT